MCGCGHRLTEHGIDGCWWIVCNCVIPVANLPVSSIDLLERIKRLEKQVNYLEARLNMDNDE